MSNIWSIILAAGESKRMGQAKMLLNINGKTMIECVVENVISSYTDNTLVVLGAHAGILKVILKKFNVSYCVNEDYKDGMLSSIQYGLSKLPSDFEAVLIFQGDQPLIKSTVVNLLIDSFKQSEKGIVIPVYKSKRGHPVLIHQKYRSEIFKLDSGEGLRSLSRIFPDDVLEVEIDEPGILRDFDTYDEYTREFNQKQ